MSDAALSVLYRRFRYQAQSDIADHGYRTKYPPMLISLDAYRTLLNGDFLKKYTKQLTLERKPNIRRT
jgi:hypothetical protein